MPSGPEAEVGAINQARAAARPTTPARRRAGSERRTEAEGQQTAEGQSADQRPEDGEAVVQSRQEPVRPDRAVGQVAEGAVIFTPAQRLLGRRQGDRPEVLDPGQRVAGVSEVAQVPVTPTGERRQARGEQGRATFRHAARSPASPTTSTARRQQKVELGPSSQPRRQPQRPQGAPVAQPALTPCTLHSTN